MPDGYLDGDVTRIEQKYNRNKNSFEMAKEKNYNPDQAQKSLDQMRKNIEERTSRFSKYDLQLKEEEHAQNIHLKNVAKELDPTLQKVNLGLYEGDVLSNDDYDKIMDQTAPMPAPDFKVLTKKEFNKLSKTKKAEYLEEEADFQQKLDLFAKNETKRQEAVRQMASVDKIIAETHKEIPVNADGMMAAIQEQTKDEASKVKMNALNRVRAEAFIQEAKYNPKRKLAPTAVRAYLGEWYENMNHHLRTNDKTRDGKAIPDVEIEMVKSVKESLSNNTLKKDMVLYRGAGINTLASMMGTEPVTEEKLQEHLKELATKEGNPNKVWSKADVETYRTRLNFEKAKKDMTDRMNKKEEVVLEEKGFCSTSNSMGGRFAKQPLKIFILAHAGTQGMEIAGTHLAVHSDESEVLLNANTKFRLVDIKEDGPNTNVYLEVLSREENKEKTNESKEKTNGNGAEGGA